MITGQSLWPVQGLVIQERANKLTLVNGQVWFWMYFPIRDNNLEGARDRNEQGRI